MIIGMSSLRQPLSVIHCVNVVLFYSTYVTGGGGPGGPYSSIDEAYHYYGMKNPLDIGDAGGGGGGGGKYHISPMNTCTDLVFNGFLNFQF